MLPGYGLADRLLQALTFEIEEAFFTNLEGTAAGEDAPISGDATSDRSVQITIAKVHHIAHGLQGPDGNNTCIGS